MARFSLVCLAAVVAVGASTPESLRDNLAKMLKEHKPAPLGFVRAGRLDVTSKLSLRELEPVVGVPGVKSGECKKGASNAKEAYENGCASIDAMSYVETGYGGDTPHGGETQTGPGLPEQSAVNRQACMMSKLVASHYLAVVMSTWLGPSTVGPTSSLPYIPIAYTASDDSIRPNPELISWVGDRNTYEATPAMRESRSSMMKVSTSSMLASFCGTTADEQLRSTFGSRTVTTHRGTYTGTLNHLHCSEMLGGVRPRYESRMVANFESGCIARNRNEGDAIRSFGPYNCPLETLASSLRTGAGGGSGPAGCDSLCPLHSSGMSNKEGWSKFASGVQGIVNKLQRTPMVSEAVYNANLKAWDQRVESMRTAAKEMAAEGASILTAITTGKAILAKRDLKLNSLSTESVVTKEPQAGAVKCRLLTKDQQGFPGVPGSNDNLLPPVADTVKNLMSPEDGVAKLTSIKAQARFQFTMECAVEVETKQEVTGTVATEDPAKWSVPPLDLANPPAKPLPYPAGRITVDALYIPMFGNTDCDPSTSAFTVEYTVTINGKSKVLPAADPVKALEGLVAEANLDIAKFDESYITYQAGMRAWVDKAQRTISNAETKISRGREIVASIKAQDEDDGASLRSQAEAQADLVESESQQLAATFPKVAREAVYTASGLGAKLTVSALAVDAAPTDVCHGADAAVTKYKACSASG